ncbi:unnamed protein product, partial [Closterium sp. NIES-64]
ECTAKRAALTDAGGAEGEGAPVEVLQKAGAVEGEGGGINGRGEKPAELPTNVGGTECEGAAFEGREKAGVVEGERGGSDIGRSEMPAAAEVTFELIETLTGGVGLKGEEGARCAFTPSSLPSAGAISGVNSSTSSSSSSSGGGFFEEFYDALPDPASAAAAILRGVEEHNKKSLKEVVELVCAFESRPE